MITFTLTLLTDRNGHRVYWELTTDKGRVTVFWPRLVSEDGTRLRNRTSVT